MTTVVAFIFWIASLQGTPAATVPQPPRLPARTTVEGTTVRSDASDSLSFVTLKLVPLDEQVTAQLTARGGANSSGNYQVQSDAAGKFQFANILPGRYAITAEREGFVPADQFLPGPRQSMLSILTISAGMKVDGLIVAMNPVPTISGTVYSPLGQRLAGVTVQAYRVQYTPYGRQLVRVASVISHEGGEYRLFRLSPGYYYVTASYSETSLRPWKSILDLTPNLANPDDGYSTVYHPGEMKLANAKVLNLYNGSVSNADISFKETRYYKLSIKVLLPPPQQPNLPPLSNLKVALFPSGTDLGSAQDYVIQGSGMSYSVPHLAEGDYVLVALADFRDPDGNTYVGAVSDTVPVRVTDNVEVEVATMDPFELPGSMARLLAGTFPTGMQVQLVRVDPYARQTMTARVYATGEFTFARVGPGTYDVFVQGMPRNAYLQSAGFSYSDRRLLQIRIDGSLPTRSWHCEPGCPAPHWMSDFPVLVSLGTTGSTVSGLVADANGRLVSGAEIVLVPTDPGLRLRKDRYGIGFADASGAYQLQGIAPGTYTLYAFEKIEPDIYYDPEFNNQIARQGTAVNVSAGLNRPLERALVVITKEDLARLTR